MGEVVKVVPKKAQKDAKKAPKESAKMSNGEKSVPVPDANGNIEDQPVANGGEAVKDANGNVEEVVAESAGDRQTKTVLSVVTKLNEDTKLSDCEKIDTLCLLVQRIVEENKVLKNEIAVVGDQCEKQREAKEVILTLNTAYKKQIDLVREESRLRLEEEMAKRSENMGGYNTTMTDLSNLLETHTAQNSRLRDQNAQMASKMGELVGETEKRDEMVKGLHEEAQLQIVLLQHQVQKAQIEKAEIKADMTKDRLELSQDLLLERERGKNLEETVRLLKEQAEIYQLQMEELQAGGASNSKSFNHFKTQIDKLTKSMTQLEKDTANWRQKYEVSSSQVKKMNTSAMERESEVVSLKKKLESMVKLNKTLSQERATLLEKCKEQATLFGEMQGDLKGPVATSDAL